jgi:hypothetical protein
MSLTRETLPNFFGNVASATVLAMVGLLFSATSTGLEKECRGSQPLVVVVVLPAPAKLDQPDETKTEAMHLRGFDRATRLARNSASGWRDTMRGEATRKLSGHRPAQRRGGMTANKDGSA